MCAEVKPVFSCGDSDKRFNVYVGDDVPHAEMIDLETGAVDARFKNNDVIAVMKWAITGGAMEAFDTLVGDLDACTLGRWSEAFGVDVDDLLLLFDPRQMPAFNG